MTKCKCGEELRTVEVVAGYKYASWHTNSSNGMGGPTCADVTFARELHLSGPNAVTLDSCPSCKQGPARFQPLVLPSNVAEGRTMDLAQAA